MLYALVLTQATAYSHCVVGYLGTLAEHIGIANGVTIYPTALYKIRMKVIIVDLCTCHRQGLVAIVGTARQQHHY